ncbi:MAG: hypothetical protein K6A40_05490 [Solobacterium sp.]|nr:hypothetical protein [Solobacterium sp.]
MAGVNKRKFAVCLDPAGGRFTAWPEEAVCDEATGVLRFSSEEEIFRCFVYDLFPVKGDLTIKGFNTEADGSGKLYSRRDLDGGIPVHEDMTLYAVWEEAWVLKLDYCGGHHRLFSDETEKTILIAKEKAQGDSTWYYTSDIDEPVNADPHLGFAGWFDENGESTKKQYPSAIIYERDTVMKARWKEAWALTFHAGDGSFSMNEERETEIYSCVKGEWLSTYLAAVNDDPERALLGYRTAESNEVVLDRNNYLELRPSSDMEYYAVYEEGGMPVSGIHFRMDALYLSAGETHDLTEFAVRPKEARVYTKKLITDNDSVVRIGRKGQLVAVAPGTCTITLTLNRKVTASIPVRVYPDDENAPVKVYHLYSRGSSDHMLTARKKERNALVNLGWIYDAVAFYAPQDGELTCYRLYNKENAIHFFTVDEKEKEKMLSEGWTDEGVCCKCTADGHPVTRLSDPKAEIKGYVFTSSEKEKEFYLNKGYQDEGISWYGFDDRKGDSK